jgi:hypothetical protein
MNIKIKQLYILPIILYSFLCFLFSPSFAQNLNDTAKIQKIDTTKAFISTKNTNGFISTDSLKPTQIDSSNFKKSPVKAALFSLVLPGAGQIYNKKYWKVPIIYSLFGTLYYFSDRNNRQYHRYLNAYIGNSKNKDTIVDGIETGLYPPENLISAKDYYRRNRDFTYILLGLAFFANVLDACVDTYMLNYDIGDDLSLRMRPIVIPTFAYGNYFGIKLELKF